MIEQHWGIICDYCNHAMDYISGVTKKEAQKYFKRQDEFIFYKDKAFCGTLCYTNFLRQRINPNFGKKLKECRKQAIEQGVERCLI